MPLGISLGKSKVTPLDEAVDDYLASLRAAARRTRDYFAVNVSLAEHARAARAAGPRPLWPRCWPRWSGGPPVLVKIAPDLTEPAIAELLEVCLAHGAAGVIATNTTLARDGLAAGRPAAGRARRAGCPGGR